jgi:tyrosine-protein phosphatase YwqE
MGDPQLSTIYLKGNRMATVTAESIVICDLDKETVTRVDLQKHTWYTITFEQMRQNFEKLRAKLEKHPATKSDAIPTAEVSFDVKVRNTGAKKTVSGLPTTEAILSMAMNTVNTGTQQTGTLAITNDMWMTPGIPRCERRRRLR